MMKIREILNSKIKEGLDVQIVVNQTGHDQKKKTFAMQYFGEANECGCVHYYPMGQYHHEKVVIIDKKIVYLGSHNLTSTSLCSFSEVSVRLDSEESAGILSNIINLWR